MKRLIATLMLATTVTMGGCAFFNRVKATTCPTPVVCATTILMDFRWGVDQAGSQQWLSAADVTLADNAVLAGLDTVAAIPANWKLVVTTTLTSIQAHVSQADRWAPYIDAAKVVLALVRS